MRSCVKQSAPCLNKLEQVFGEVLSFHGQVCCMWPLPSKLQGFSSSQPILPAQQPRTKKPADSGHVTTKRPLTRSHVLNSLSRALAKNLQICKLHHGKKNNLMEHSSCQFCHFHPLPWQASFSGPEARAGSPSCSPEVAGMLLCLALPITVPHVHWEPFTLVAMNLESDSEKPELNLGFSIIRKILYPHWAVSSSMNGNHNSRS